MRTFRQICIYSLMIIGVQSIQSNPLKRPFASLIDYQTDSVAQYALNQLSNYYKEDFAYNNVDTYMMDNLNMLLKMASSKDSISTIRCCGKDEIGFEGSFFFIEAIIVPMMGINIIDEFITENNNCMYITRHQAIGILLWYYTNIHAICDSQIIEFYTSDLFEFFCCKRVSSLEDEFFYSDKIRRTLNGYLKSYKKLPDWYIMPNREPLYKGIY